MNAGSDVRPLAAGNAARHSFIWASLPTVGEESRLVKQHQKFTLAGMAMTRHCWKCGAEYTLAGSPGRSETCLCGADLKVCLNCVSYDPKVAYQCRDRRAELVDEKHVANYCEYFEMARREYVARTEETSREDKARAQLKKLLGD